MERKQNFGQPDTVGRAPVILDSGVALRKHSAGMQGGYKAALASTWFRKEFISPVSPCGP